MPRLSKIGAAALAAFGWTSGVSAVTASVLVVAGGGGGGADSTYGGGGWKGGAGGAGGYLEQSNRVLSPTVTYTITVGGGGSAGASAGASGGAGSNSVFDTSTALGGGAGAGSNGTTVANGNSGGSGGGAAGGLNGVPIGGSTGTGGSATQGNSGGATGYGNAGGTSGYATAGGGGGAGGAGSNQVSSAGGGAGRASSISGSSVTYAAGGAVAGGVAGTTSTGNGGSGGSGNGAVGYAGGSGIVIISYAGAQQFGGGVVTSSGGSTIHTFTTSGTLVPVTPLTASYLIVAGGGGGGRSTVGNGGGGAGGLLSGSSLTIDTNSIYLVTVGAGGNGATGTANGSSGTNSTFSLVSTTAIGGGGGDGAGSGANAGGSGGGGRNDGTAGGAGTSGQGFAGGNGSTGSPYPGAGGGGASAAGQNSQASTGGVGGAGIASSISGASVTYAGGGGGGCFTGGTGAAGGAGGGGAGGNPGVAGTSGTANLGGGGGGGGSSANGGNGGSGVVIISYAGATQLMAGGTVTISGGNVIHTFTSTGYLTPLKYVGNSLRFRSSASAYLDRTPPVASNRKLWTWSGWVKRGALSTAAEQQLFMAGTATDYTVFGFPTSDAFNFQNVTASATNTRRITTQVFRDPAAWYHFVVVFDTDNATANNRCRIYVNGIEITAFGTLTNPSTGAVGQINNNVAHYISRNSTAAVQYLDGYLTEINFIDGQALTPNSFGTFNSYGVWQPITYGGSYGTNGFYLPFSNTTSTTTLGYDFSPNGNNWTTNNISLTAGVTYDSMTDVPTLTSATAANFCTWNPVNVSGGGTTTITNGNLATSVGSTTTFGKVLGSIGMSTGKWYWEVTVTAVGGAGNIGIGDGTAPSGSFGLGGVAGEIAYQSSGNKYTNNSGTAYGATYTTNDIIGVAYDADAGSITFYKNNSSQGAITGFSGTKFAAVGSGGGTNPQYAVNFGQRPFSFSPPSGYVALNTYNL